MASDTVRCKLLLTLIVCLIVAVERSSLVIADVFVEETAISVLQNRSITSIDVSGNLSIVGSTPNAYIFQYNGSHWELSQVLTASDDYTSNGEFGLYVAICATGPVAIVGSDDHKAYIFQQTNNVYWQETAILAVNASNYVDIYNNLAIVGAYQQAYIFQLQNDTNKWIQIGELAYKNTVHQISSVSISANLAIVGREMYCHNYGIMHSGEVRFFQLNYNSSIISWKQVFNFTFHGNELCDYIMPWAFGFSIAIPTFTDIYNNFAIVSQPCVPVTYILEYNCNYNYNCHDHFYSLNVVYSTNVTYGPVGISQGFAIIGPYRLSPYLSVTTERISLRSSVYKYDTINSRWSHFENIATRTDMQPLELVVVSDSFVIGTANDAIYFVSIKSIADKPFEIIIDYQYDTTLDITKMCCRDTSDFSFSNDECVDSKLPTTTSFLSKGIYKIEFTDCDNSPALTQTNKHGIYTIKSMGNTAAFGGYYRYLETNLVSTSDSDHISFCIIPGYCTNNDKLYISYTTYTSVASYKSVTNSTITLSNGYFDPHANTFSGVCQHILIGCQGGVGTLTCVQYLHRETSGLKAFAAMVIDPATM